MNLKGPKMRVYCDTDTLFHNIERHADQPRVKLELDALLYLLKQVCCWQDRNAEVSG
jgi:hypothetical protein